MFGISNPSPVASPDLSPLRQRMLEVSEKYSEQLPIMARTMLKGFLPTLDSVSDETVLAFVYQVRAVLDYVQYGPEGMIPFADRDG